MLIPHIPHGSEVEEDSSALVSNTPFIAPALGPIRPTKHLLPEHKHWLEQFNGQYALAARQYSACAKSNFAKEVTWWFLDEFFPSLSYLEADRYHGLLWKVIYHWYNNNVNTHGRRRRVVL
ncbi:hypothetical protein BDV93DRAFT_516520 [Ceratobasidium sp. AG-I]|nr:hypothetical protein BDV93DRAFT_516520 [Ceratobasidium sp. AG-I]